jgi:hypothetical protein
MRPLPNVKKPIVLWMDWGDFIDAIWMESPSLVSWQMEADEVWGHYQVWRWPPVSRMESPKLMAD